MYRDPNEIQITVTVDRRSLSRALIAMQYGIDGLNEGIPLDTAIELFLFAYGKKGGMPFDITDFENFDDPYGDAYMQYFKNRVTDAPPKWLSWPDGKKDDDDDTVDDDADDIAVRHAEDTTEDSAEDAEDDEN